MTVRSLASSMFVVACFLQPQFGKAGCLETSIKIVEQNPQDFDGKEIAVNAVFHISPHGRLLTDPDDEHAGLRLATPSAASSMPLVDALEKNLFHTKTGVYNEKITGVFCGIFDGKNRVLILHDIKKLTIEMQSRPVKGNGPIYP